MSRSAALADFIALQTREEAPRPGSSASDVAVYWLARRPMCAAEIALRLDVSVRHARVLLSRLLKARRIAVAHTKVMTYTTADRWGGQMTRRWAVRFYIAERRQQQRRSSRPGEGRRKQDRRRRAAGQPKE